MFLNIYRTAVFIHDRLCIGDSVRVKEGPMESRRGTVKKFLDGGMVLIEREFGSVASNVSTPKQQSLRVTHYSIGRMSSAYTRAREDQSHLRQSRKARSCQQTGPSYKWNLQESYRICILP
jgi:hypothetical protein